MNGVNGKVVKPKVCMELRETYPEYFRKWQGKQVGAHLQGGEKGEVVMNFGGDDLLSSSDSGQTWHKYEEKHLWPLGFSKAFRVGGECIAIGSDGYAISRSIDNGLTWSEPQTIAPATSKRYPNIRGSVWGIEVTLKGRIILAEDYLTGREGPDPNVLFVNISDDAGRTWRRSKIIEPPAPLPKSPEGFGEPSVVELADETIWMVFRSLYGHLWQCISKDGGLTWEPPCSTGLASPLSNAKVERIPGSDSVVLFWNFAKPGLSKKFGDNLNVWRPRSPLVFSVSHDGCRTWSCPTVIYEGTGIMPSVHFTDKEMFVCFMSTPDLSPKVIPGSEDRLTLVVYDKEDVLHQPAWTQETILPYIADGLVAHWLILNLP